MDEYLRGVPGAVSNTLTVIAALRIRSTYVLSVAVATVNVTRYAVTE